ncbi:MAG: NifU family protein [Bdellovibrio sp.]|nr:MAG: NifU family protein [Bdellovibrio sp.]
MMSDKKFQVHFEPTPNPQSMKFVLNQKVCTENLHFEDPLKAQRSPLASKIFGFPWTSSVFLGPDFVTITKQDWVDWDVLAEPLCELIKEHMERGEPFLLEEPENTFISSEDDSDPIVQQIKEILDTEIRPAVAMDGGDIVFHKFEAGVVYVYMQGACSGCPSSTMTLKAGIEQRLKELIPEVVEVVAL